MKKKFKNLGTISLVLLTVSFGYTQSTDQDPSVSQIKVAKKSCTLASPSCSTLKKSKTSCAITACGPKGTKTNEAKVITDLRNEVSYLKKEFKNKASHNFDSQFLNTPVPTGNGDDDSLVLLEKEITYIENVIGHRSTISTDALEEGANKAQLLASLSERVQQIKTNALGL